MFSQTVLREELTVIIMKFKSKWITTRRFAELKPIDTFHKELTDTAVYESAVKNYHVHFRKKILIENVGKVEIRISADDYYKLYVNGKFIAQGPAPAYYNAYNYNEIDISEHMTVGENVIAVHVYYQGEINRVWNSGDNRQGMIADIFADGDYICGTDEDWLYSEAAEFSGVATGYKTTYLENIDFNLKEQGWKDADYCDGHYSPAVVKEDDDHIFKDSPVRCVDVYKVKPQRVVKIKKGDYFIDFGREIAGQFYMKAKGKAGQSVTVMHAEETVDGNPYEIRYNMRCNCYYRENCVLSGGEDEFEFFDYKSFRYVRLTADDDVFCPESFCSIARNNLFKLQLTLKTDLQPLEDIWNMCVNTLRVGVQEGFLDCPTREKGQYMGDFTVSGKAYMYITGDSEIYKKTLFDFAETARVCSGLLSVAPGGVMQEIADFSLQYPMQVLAYYEYTRDKDALCRLHPVICGILNYFKQFERADGLLERVDEKWNLVDWPPEMRDEYDADVDDRKKLKKCHNVLNAFYIGALKASDAINTILGLRCDNKTERVINAYMNVFYDARRRLFRDAQGSVHYALHSNVLPVFFEIAPKESERAIKEMIVKKGLRCGTYFSYFVLKALARLGAYDTELRLILSDGSHSWLNMLREGATTCFEVWGKDQKWNTSLCHPWSCAPIIAIVEDLANKYPSIKITALKQPI